MGERTAITGRESVGCHQVRQAVRSVFPVESKIRRRSADDPQMIRR